MSELGTISKALGEAVEAAQAALQPVLGTDVQIVVNAAANGMAFGSRIPDGCDPMLANSLSQSYDEAREA